MMFSFFFVIELVRVLYEYLHIWAYGVSCFALIALWFSFPRAMLNKVAAASWKAEGQF